MGKGDPYGLNAMKDDRVSSMNDLRQNKDFLKVQQEKQGMLLSNSNYFMETQDELYLKKKLQSLAP